MEESKSQDLDASSWTVLNKGDDEIGPSKVEEVLDGNE